MVEQLVVDGYNIIHAWPDLRKWIDDDLDVSRKMLVDMLREYQGVFDNYITVVFDAYQTKALETTVEHYGKVTVIYTKSEETADQYIERMVARINHKHYRVRVATSDWLQQTLILGQGASRVSANELRQEVLQAKETLKRDYLEKNTVEKNGLEHNIAPDILRELERMRRNQ